MNKVSFKNFAERRKTGVYVSCTYTTDTILDVGSWVINNLVRDPLSPAKYHSTILYSREDVPTVNEIIDKIDVTDWVFKATELKLFDSDDPELHSLVIALEAPQMVALHKALIDAGGTHDYEDFVPHLTVSYMVPRTTNLAHFKVPTFMFKVNKLKTEPLDLNWKDA